MKKGLVYKKDKLAGTIWEDESGYHFQYDKSYLNNPVYGEISKTLILRKDAFVENNMIPFFDGLIPEGWLLKIAIDNWKLNPRDRATILILNVCRKHKQRNHILKLKIKWKKYLQSLTEIGRPIEK